MLRNFALSVVIKNLDNCMEVTTPLAQCAHMRKYYESINDDASQLWRLVIHLMYVIMMRLDISFTVSVYSNI